MPPAETVARTTKRAAPAPRRKKSNKFYDSAIALLQAGFSVLPCHNHPNKKPALLSWTELQTTPMAQEQASKEFVNGVSIGVICGKVSGNLECLDFDQADLYQPFMDMLKDITPALAQKLVKRQTPSGGFHLIYRCQSSISGSQKLTMSKDGNATWIETRGEGGYFLTAPSPGYKVLEHSMLDVPTLTAAERGLLHSISKSFSEKEEPVSKPQGQRVKVDGVRPGDDFNNRADFHQLLENNGWTTKGRTGPGGDHWTRPGKKTGSTSATLKDGCLYVFSSSTPLPMGPNDAFSFYTHIKHNGDYSAAARKLGEKGYGEKANSTGTRGERGEKGESSTPGQKKAGQTGANFKG